MKRALLQLHAAIFLWGFTGVLGRAITLDATLLVWYRLLITLISLWVLFALQKKNLPHPTPFCFADWRHWPGAGTSLGNVLWQHQAG